jgi:hypothetical protein
VTTMTKTSSLILFGRLVAAASEVESQLGLPGQLVFVRNSVKHKICKNDQSGGMEVNDANLWDVPRFKWARGFQ